MQRLSEYKIVKELYFGNYVIFYGISLKTNSEVLLKTTSSDYPSSVEFERLKKEFEIGSSFHHENIIRYLEYFEINHKPYLVLEYFNAIPLSSLIYKKKITITEFSKIAIQIASALDEIHKKNIVHKDINPNNILIQDSTYKLKIIDFGISSVLKRQFQTISNLNKLEGTVSYISPEQSGRMNRSIDYRSDFYSLGVTLFELLTQHLPFPSTDLLEVVHSHIAKVPPNIRVLNPDVPYPLANIIMKLLEKNPEMRYKSATGLIYDIEHLPIELGTQDFSPIFQIPEKLYGREKQIANLLSSYESIDSQKMILVSGYSGVGKSALIREIHKPILKEKGIFLSGKFDQFQKTIPYFAFKNVFEELIRYILSGNQQSIELWRNSLRLSLGTNGKVIINLVPDFEKIIGKQPELEELDPTSSLNRFQSVFVKLFKGLSNPSQPLVIFFDDLQWIDSASLRLIEVLMNEPEIKSVLFIGAYRDNEVLSSHPLSLFIRNFENSPKGIKTIHLESLRLQDIEELLSETFSLNNDKVKDFAQLLLNKTGGNSYFIKLLLNQLYEEGYIDFNNHKSWHWDLNKIKKFSVTDNVIDMAIRKINKLSSKVIEVLKVAACIGNRFELNLISAISDIPIQDLNSILEKAIQEEVIYISAKDDNFIYYKFIHDRIQQASYSLIPEEERKATHLKIAKFLLKDKSLNDFLFDIANQFQQSIDLIHDAQEKIEYANIFLKASSKANESAAYNQSYLYLQVARNLLPKDSWISDYALTLNILTSYARAALLIREYGVMHAIADEVLNKAKTILDKVPIYENKILYHSYKTELHEAVNVSREILYLLGVILPKKPKLKDIFIYLFKAKFALRGKSMQDLEKLPVMTDPNLLAASRIITSAASAAYFTSAEMLSCMFLSGVTISAKYGNSPYSAYFYSGYALLLCGALNDLVGGEKFGQLALKLLDTFDANSLRCRTNFLYHAFTSHWTHPLRDSLKKYMKAYEYGIDFGDLEYATGNLLFHAMSSLNIGRNLVDLNQEIENYKQFITLSGQDRNLNVYLVIQQFIHNFLDLSKNPTELTGLSYDESVGIQKSINNNDIMALCWIYLYKSILHYIFKELDAAFNTIKKIEPYLPGILAQNLVYLASFYETLILLDYYSDKKIPRKQKSKISNNIKKLNNWSKFSSENVKHKYLLLIAKQNEKTGNIQKIISLYADAINQAKQSGYLLEEALSNELAGNFLWSIGLEKIASPYLRDAYYLYERWGAKAKLKQMQSYYLETQSKLHFTNKRRFSEHYSSQMQSSSLSSSSKTISFIDTTSALKTTHLISSEILLDELLTKFMRISSENAGATNGFLILRDKDRWIVNVEYDIEKDIILKNNALFIEEVDNLSTAVLNYVIRTRESLVIGDASSDLRFQQDKYIESSKPKSILCMSLIHQGDQIGVLYLENKFIEDAFTEDRLETLRIISSQAVISIVNAKLVEDIILSKRLLEDQNANLEKNVQERTYELQQSKNVAEKLLQEIKTDLLLAKKIQQNILPKDLKLSPQLEVNITFLPLNEVGGDLYDITKLSDTKFRFFIADATGHGLQAALLTMTIKSEYENIKNSNLSPSQLLNTINEQFYKKYKSLTTFFSCIILDLDLAKNELLFSSAGHPAQFYIDQKNTNLMEKQGRLIGILGDTKYKDISFPFYPGSKIFLFTDGAYEQFSQKREEYGEERLINIINENQNESGEDILNNIIKSLDEFSGDGHREDDLTMIWINYKK